IESVSLKGIMTSAIDGRSLIRVGRDAAIRSLSVDMDVNDPSLQAIPLNLIKGGRVQRLNFALNWNAREVDIAKNPIQHNGGTIEQLHWVNTPPMYVGAEVAKTDPHTVTARFSQIVKGSDLAKGVQIR